jgi:hypothetical protein
VKVNYRDIPHVCQTETERGLMRQNYSPDAMNVYIFIGLEVPYLPILMRVRPPSIHLIREAILVADRTEISDVQEVYAVRKFLCQLAEKDRSFSGPEVRMLFWPMIEHNIPEIKEHDFKTIPEKNCVFLRLTVDDEAFLVDSIYASFTHVQLDEDDSTAHTFR